MKKTILILTCLLSLATRSEVILRSNPILFAVGALNAELNYPVFEKISLGLGGISWNSSIKDTDFSISEVHTRVDYWFSGTFKEGWYANTSFSSMALFLNSKNLVGKKYEGDVKGSGLIIGGGHHWQWESFHMELGLQFASYSFDSSMELVADDGAVIKEDIPGRSTMNLEVNIGWLF